jgi:hypothetical protein
MANEKLSTPVDNRGRRAGAENVRDGIAWERLRVDYRTRGRFAIVR